jgi:hypothetical protein
MHRVFIEDEIEHLRWCLLSAALRFFRQMIKILHTINNHNSTIEVTLVAHLCGLGR